MASGLRPPQRIDAVVRLGSYFAVVGLSRIPYVESVGWQTPVNSYVAVGNIVATAAMLFGRVRCEGIRVLGDRFKIKKYQKSPEELARKLARDLDLVVSADCNLRGAITVRKEREWLEDMYRFAITNRTEDALLDHILWLSSNYGVQLSKATFGLPSELVDHWRRSGISIRRDVTEAVSRYRNNLLMLVSEEAKVASIYEGYIFGPRFPRDIAEMVIRNVSLMREVGELLDNIRSSGLAIFTRQEYEKLADAIGILEQADEVLVVTDEEFGLVYVFDKAVTKSVAAAIFGKSDVDELSRDKRAAIYLLLKSVARARHARQALNITEEEARKAAFEYIARATGKTVEEIEKDLAPLLDLVSGGAVLSRFSIGVAGNMAVEEIRRKVVAALQKRQPRITDFV